MTDRVPLETRQHEHEEARRYTGENEIYSNKRSVFSQLFLWLVITVLVVTTGCDRELSKTTPIIVDVSLDSSPETIPTVRLIKNEELDKKIVQILAWIKTKNPEWNTVRENLILYLANQAFIDTWLKNEYDNRKKRGLPVPEYFNEAGRTAAFFTELNSKYYIYLPWDFTLSELSSEDTLVHELVHYVQRINGVEAACQGDREFSAHFFVLLYLLEEKGLAADSEQVIWNMQEAADYICPSD